MRRKAHNRLWTLILMLALCGAGTMPAARSVWAGTTPTDAPPPGTPPPPGAGDPDSPDGKSMPKPGGHGAIQVGRSFGAPRQDTLSIWMRFRIAFAFAYRFLFRF